jgi:GNAT superfamily N-acetyltransferase
MNDFRIREARLPADAPSIVAFIRALQEFEHGIEPDRRVDAAVAEDFFAVLTARVEARHGSHFIAEAPDGTKLGWAAVHEHGNEIYVVEDERVFGFISELFVVEAARGRGIGQALIAACEDWARSRGLKLVMIAALSGNARAFGAYRAAGYAPYATELRKYLK